jgi:hypothetical protein
VKNAGLGFAISYHHNGQPHDYVPDFIVRLAGEPLRHLNPILGAGAGIGLRRPPRRYPITANATSAAISG